MSALDVALLINARERMEHDIDITQLLFDITLACHNTCSTSGQIKTMSDTYTDLPGDWPATCFMGSYLLHVLCLLLWYCLYRFLLLSLSSSLSLSLVPVVVLRVAASVPSDVESALLLSAFPFVEWPSSSLIDASTSPAVFIQPTTQSTHSALPPDPASLYSAHPIPVSPIRSPYGRQCVSRCVARYIGTHLSCRVSREQVVTRLVAEQRERSRRGPVRASEANR